MITGIILSKDRAFQCDLLIQSIRQNFKEVERIYVLYQTSYKEYDIGYNLIKYKNVYLIPETNFDVDYKTILNSVCTDYVLNFCDDNVIISETGVGYLLEQLKQRPEVVSASLRLHENYNYCYPAKKQITIPTLIKKRGVIEWDWTKYDPHTCWGYPHPIDNNIYLTDYFKSVIKRCGLKTPCIEAEINRKRPQSKPIMIALNETKILTITHNTAQSWNPAMINSGDNEYSIQSLNDMFLSNYTADLKDIMLNNKKVNSGWNEYKWQFVKK